MKIITPQHSDTLNLTTEKEPLAVCQFNDAEFSSIEHDVAEICPFEFQRSSDICRKDKKITRSYLHDPSTNFDKI